ncbi:excalibur calcium-binding domain-containing protein [Actinoplanes bogorensis]|uniref:Excalibur calcium-binding domain-containing protein n=1 Tax=Paractinoplanes bogorensis TaxID=1610840 RepID=A0ABS5YJ91_9ACTN|nr:excalibur calcium-binding domain-containing protein [Actinoplanes bogorensis]MBU2662779.1 excalibur calcium-binding domain-containing protein [Actinoplanes bogorensis]
MTNLVARTAVAVAVTAGLIGLSAPAYAAPKPVKYKNCTALNKVYKHGVAKLGGKDKVAKGAKPVTNFTVYTAVYKLNTKLDRDKDGVACEKK